MVDCQSIRNGEPSTELFGYVESFESACLLRQSLQLDDGSLQLLASKKLGEDTYLDKARFI